MDPDTDPTFPAILEASIQYCNALLEVYPVVVIANICASDMLISCVSTRNQRSRKLSRDTGGPEPRTADGTIYDMRTRNIAISSAVLVACISCASLASSSLASSKTKASPDDSQAQAGTTSKKSRVSKQAAPSPAANKSTAKASAGAGTFTNPVFENLADPGVIRVGDTYYVVGTGQGGFTIFSSKNLKDWSRAGDTGQGTCGQCWAPEFLAYKGKFYIVFTDGGSFTTSVAVSDKVTGPYKTVCVAGIPGIDGSLYAHTDGKVYVFYNPIKRGAIMACGEMSADLSKMTSTRDLFTGPVPGLNQKQITVEAPTVVRVGGLLYMIYSFNATGPDYNLTYATSQNPLGSWKQSGVTLLPDDKSGHGHGSPVQTKSGNWVMVCHGAAWVNNGRNLCIHPMTIGNGKVSIQYVGQGQTGKLTL